MIRQSIRAALIVVAAGACVRPALAQEPSYGPDLDRCLDTPANQGTMGMVGCFNAELERWDARLNRAYREILGAARAEAKPRLRTAQRVWIQFRDANCAVWATLEGGSLDLVNAAECRLRMTAQRVTSRVRRSAFHAECRLRMTAQRVAELERMQR